MAYVLFISEEKLKDSTAINLNVDVNLLLPYVRQAQKLYVEPKLGTKLTDKIKDLITAGTIGAGANAAYKTLLDDGNIFSKTSETGTALSTAEAQHLREEVRNTAEYYTERMIDYVTNNTASFPEYSTNTGADVDPDKNAYYNGMNLERPTKQGTKLTLRNFLTPDI